MSSSPLDQFKINDILSLHVGNYDLSFTNSSLFMFFAYAIIGSFFYFTAKKLQTIPGGMQSGAEVVYNFVLKVLNENTSGKGEQYFPFIFKTDRYNSFTSCPKHFFKCFMVGVLYSLLNM